MAKATETKEIKEIPEVTTNEIEELKKEKEAMFLQMQEMMNQMKQMQEEIKNAKNVPVLEVKKEKVRSVKLMSLSLGYCHLVDGVLNARFDKMFDVVPIRETIFQDFFYRFKKWFEDMEIVILDDEFAEEYGMKFIYEKHGVTENFMDELISMNAQNMIENLSTKIPQHQMVFVKYFATQVAKEVEGAMDVGKHYALEKYVKEKFGFEVSIKELAEEIIKL